MPEPKHVVILGAGFAGLELATRLTELVPDAVKITLIDQSDAFVFGFSKLDILFGRAGREEVSIPYTELSKPGVEFRRERVTAIDPAARRVETDGGAYDADFLAVALGADCDVAATPGFAKGGVEFYSVGGAERTAPVIAGIESGRVVIGILGHPFKCPPAPFESAFLLHDSLAERGVRDAVEVVIHGPMAAPVPITPKLSQAFLEPLAERGIEYVPNQHFTALDPAEKVAHVKDGDPVPYDLFIGIPVHRVPQVVTASGLAPDGWVPVNPADLTTSFPGVYALGDLTAIQMAKAGVFAEAAARVVADDIAARLRGGELEQPYQGAGSCYLEFGGGRVARVEANFLGGPKPTAELVGPSTEMAGNKQEFAATRRERWFG